MTKLTIETLAFGGDGIARTDEGKVVFVERALPGEQVEVRTLFEKSSFAKAQITSLLTASPERRADDCVHEMESSCGGCGFRHVRDDDALRLKAEAARSTMTKIGRDVAWPEPTLHLAPTLYGSRTRVRFQIERARLGFYRRGSHSLVQIPECHAVAPEILAVVDALESVLARAPSTPVNELLVEQVGGTTWVCWEGLAQPEQIEALAALVDAGTVGGVCVRRKRHGHTVGPQWMEASRTISLPEGTRTLKMRRKVGTFGQAHHGVNAQLCEHVLSRMRAINDEATCKRVLDLYAGSGNLTLVAALLAEMVVGVETEADAVEGLKASAALNDLAHVSGIKHDLRHGLPSEVAAQPFDLVILDPPRTGARDVLEGLLTMAPRDILYVSCSPPHLARDAQALTLGYRLIGLDAFDMFPRTPHLEMVAHWRRREGDLTRDDAQSTRGA